MDKSKIQQIVLVGYRSRTSNSYGRNLPYMRYAVMLHYKDGSKERLEDALGRDELKAISYWSTRSNTLSMTCWGTSQLFEAQIALGRWMGFDDKDWPAFSRRITSFITEY